MGRLDVLVAVVWTGFWLGLTAVVLVGGGGVLAAGLVLILGAAGLMRWLRTSWTLETLRQWRRRA
jgi:hypothetical protein